MTLALSDVAGIARLAWKVYNVGNSKYTSAQTEFSEFIRDVELLARALDALMKAAGPMDGTQGSLELDSDFVQHTLREAKCTLEVSERMIAQNGHFIKNGQGYVINILWALTIAENVKQQQDRIQVCFQRANFIMGGLRDNQLISNQRLALADSQANHEMTHELIRSIHGRESAEHAGEPTATDLLSQEISHCFADSMQSATEDRGGNMTVQACIDALSYFSERSTKHFHDKPPIQVEPSPSQYISLLKCIWLCRHIEGDPGFRHFCSDPFNRAWLGVLKRDVEYEARRFLKEPVSLSRVNDEKLLQLGELAFDIDLLKPRPPPVPSPLEASVTEFQVMDTFLNTHAWDNIEQLKIFRISEERLRLARATSERGAIAQEAYTTCTGTEIDRRSVYLSPIYALDPTGTGAPNVIWKTRAHDYGKQELSFTSMKDARQFQQIVTGYGIVWDQPALRSATKKASGFGGFFDGTGTQIASDSHVQIWVHRELPSVRAHSNSTSEDSSQTAARGSGSIPSAGLTHDTWTETTLRSRRTSTSVRSESGSVYLERPVPSKLIILTTMNSTMVAINIPVDEHTRLAPEHCRCSSKDSQNCTKAVVVRDSGKLKYRTAQVHSQNESWNVALFSHPQHLDFVDSTEEDDAKYVILEFKTAAARQGFTVVMQKVCNLMRNQIDTFYGDYKALRRLSTYSTT